jgi:hypothetical protein
MISCQVCWRAMRWHNGQTQRSRNPNPEEVLRDCLTKWEERSVFHPGPECFTPTKAVYICADQPANSFFACGRVADHTFRVACQPVNQRANLISHALFAGALLEPLVFKRQATGRLRRRRLLCKLRKPSNKRRVSSHRRQSKRLLFRDCK